MKKFKKRPVVVEAVQIKAAMFTDDHPNPEHLRGARFDPLLQCVWIQTLEGKMRGDLGDWIIRGVKGELYPCKPDVFALTYEPVED